MQKISWLMLGIVCILALMGAYYSGVESSAMAATIRFMGMGAFFLLCVSLLIGPLCVIDLKRFGAWMEPRRAVGLASFVFLAMHFFLSMENYFGWDFGAIFGNGLLTGVISAFVFLPLAITSCDFAIKVLGNKGWKYIQYLTYIAFVFGFHHYLFKASGPSVLPLGMPAWNFAELFLILLGALVVVLQAYGFYLRRKK